MERDLEAISKGNICNDNEVEKCREEYDEPELAWACENCPKVPDWQIHPYTRKLLNIRKLYQAGFPLDREMLTYEEWLDLGRVNECLTPAPSILH